MNTIDDLRNEVHELRRQNAALNEQINQLNRRFINFEHTVQRKLSDHGFGILFAYGALFGVALKFYQGGH